MALFGLSRYDEIFLSKIPKAVKNTTSEDFKRKHKLFVNLYWWGMVRDSNEQSQTPNQKTKID